MKHKKQWTLYTPDTSPAIGQWVFVGTTHKLAGHVHEQKRLTRLVTDPRAGKPKWEDGPIRDGEYWYPAPELPPIEE